MKYISYSKDGINDYGILSDDNLWVVSITDILKTLKMDVPDSLLSFINKYSHSLRDQLASFISENIIEKIPAAEVKLTAPIPNPRRNVFCLGKNYADHALEVKSLPGGEAKIPDYPIYFTKLTDPAIGPMDKVIIPKDITNKLDYEVELAVIIGKDGKNIPAEEVEDYIFGYTISNDISARDIQTKHIQWFKGKSFDTFMPMGPYILDIDEIKFPVELDISCSVNGELRQHSNTKNLIFDIPYIISDLSNGLTLKAGDIILTGTPAGVGMGFSTPKFLKSGDVVKCSIEKLGELINIIE